MKKQSKGGIIIGLAAAVMLLLPVPKVAAGMVEEPEIVEENSAADSSEVNGGNNIASGVDGKITWTIDADGKLTVEGSGNLSNEFYDGDEGVAWRPYRDGITSAKVSVSGMISTGTPGCTIYYTTDGTVPSAANGRKISGSSGVVTVGEGKTVKAVAVRSCFTNSEVAVYKQK